MKPTASERKKIQIASKHLNKKLKLERKLATRIRRFLKRQSVYFRKKWDHIGAAEIDIEQSHTLYKILENHYEKTVKIFSKQILNDINSELVKNNHEPIEEGDPGLISAIILFIRRNVTLSTDKINETSAREFSTFVETNSGDTKIAEQKMKSRAAPRSTSIAVTETQKAAEGSKFVVQRKTSEIAEDMALIPIIFQNTKTWITMMDSDVRTEHNDALFQQVLASSPFSVGGEQLMFPGDYSLGASLWNIIHCRCVVIYDILIRNI